MPDRGRTRRTATVFAIGQDDSRVRRDVQQTMFRLIVLTVAAYRLATALTYSRVMRAMLEMGISFGQTASHSPSFEQLPKPSLSACSIIATTRRERSIAPCGSSA